MLSTYLDTGYDALYKAWKNFKKGKKASAAIDAFAYNLEGNLLQLSAELTSGTYKHDGYQPVILYEKKRRDLAVATVRDRAVHRLLYNHLVTIFDKGFDPDVWSSRKGKGLHACLSRTQRLMQQYPNGFIWRADITKFYDHVDQTVLGSCLRRKISDDQTAVRIIDEVVSSYSIIKQASKQARHSHWQFNQSNILQYLSQRVRPIRTS